jgi:thiol-disulfide isomerase/thioredoxin
LTIAGPAGYILKTRGKIMRAALVGAVVGALITSCNRPPASKAKTSSAGAEVIDAQWTEAAAKQAEALVAAKKLTYELPELRIYDARQQLIYHRTGIDPDTIAKTLDGAIAAKQPIAGPSYSETAADLETADHKAISAILQPNGAVTIFDYWAEWCVPCKILEKQMLAWAAQQRPGSVRIVRAEADLTKLQRGRGGKIYVLEEGPDGKLIKVEMK